ncbi:MAG: PorT family protein [Bacteroidales bacterium]|nr:PorT family protein [Bacteroidales bacterium]
MNRQSILLAAMSLSAMAATAQNKVGEFSIKPMIGINVSDITTNEEITYKTKYGFAEGLEAEYGVKPWVGISLGAIYSQQGAWYKASVLGEGVNEAGHPVVTMLAINGRLKADYINLPLMANVYLFKGLALKTGLQVGFNVHDKLSYSAYYAELLDFRNQDTFIIDYSNNGNSSFISTEGTVSDVSKTVDLGIPVGISYEYKNITLDARYYFGLTNMNDVEDSEVMHNRVLSITLGYKFKL